MSLFFFTLQSVTLKPGASGFMVFVLVSADLMLAGCLSLSLSIYNRRNGVCVCVCAW